MSRDFWLRFSTLYSLLSKTTGLSLRCATVDRHGCAALICLCFLAR